MVRDDIKKVMIIGSGPIVIGQACEFDYSGTQACKALRECGYKIVLVNSNPATIMTDPVMADATYIEPLNVARLEQIIVQEKPDALLPNLGGQTGLNLALELDKAGILEKYGIDINDPINGILLPTNKKGTLKGTLHGGRHTKRYCDEVNNRLRKARSKEECIYQKIQ